MQDNIKLDLRQNAGIEIKSSPSVPAYQRLQDNFLQAYQVVEDVVLKNYITELHNLDLKPFAGDLKTALKEVRLFRITEMVYEKDEAANYKFASVFNAVAETRGALFTIITSDGKNTEFYMGTRNLDVNTSPTTCYNTLLSTLKGQFPGIKVTEPKNPEILEIINKFPTDSISSVTCVADNKDSHFFENRTYLQGLEKLALSMSGKKYTAVILANPTSQAQLRDVRNGYENIYSQLSPFSSSIVNYGTTASHTEGTSSQQTESDSFTNSINNTKTDSETLTETRGRGSSVSAPTTKAKIGAIAGGATGTALAIVGGIIGSAIPIPGVGTAAGVMIGSRIGSMLGSQAGSAITTLTQENETTSDNESRSVSEGKSHSQSEGYSESKSHAYSTGTNVSDVLGQSQGMQLTVHNKSLENILKKIDAQLDRLDEFESVGMWECATYFLSDDTSVSIMGAATYKALMRGDETGVETSAINTWARPTIATSGNTKWTDNEQDNLCNYVKCLMHPVFEYPCDGPIIPVTPASLISGNELSIHMGLPRKSVSGFPVVEHASFGKEVVNPYAEKATYGNSLSLGRIFDMGRAIGEEGDYYNTGVVLDLESLSMHTFITGATGSGKSNTIYQLLSELQKLGKSFMIIEPAKGEYKNVFGNQADVRVFGTNPSYSDLLQINPFRFPEGVHVLEHVDRLIEIFNVCWPMYAAMPAVLKDSVLQAYQVCGWDLIDSKNSISPNLFPTFHDLQNEIIKVIESSAYSQEVKSNYLGSLATRIKSLANGLNGQIFASNEIDNTVLFDKNVIVDLSRVGSLETKSLIMGVLVMRLNEHRMANVTCMNSPLKHITVLEEAHNILKRASSEQNPETPSVAGKSVEMLSNAIAEMRTYGEGFIIADQSPSAVDISAIRNTNTKIIMRLPDETDRRLAGRAAALKDDQLDEIAKLPKGVAVVYQNDWLEPVLCKVNRFTVPSKQYEFSPTPSDRQCNEKRFRSELLKLLLKGRLADPDRVDISVAELKHSLPYAPVSTRNKIGISQLIREYESSGRLRIWEDTCFGDLSGLVVELLECKSKITNMVQTALDFDDLTHKLRTIIDGGTEGINCDLAISISQCFMKDYTTTYPERIEIYAAWRESVLQKGVF